MWENNELTYIIVITIAYIKYSIDFQVSSQHLTKTRESSEIINSLFYQALFLSGQDTKKRLIPHHELAKGCISSLVLGLSKGKAC